MPGCCYGECNGRCSCFGEIPEVVTDNLESEISFEELIICWSHGYTTKGMLRKIFSMSKGTASKAQWQDKFLWGRRLVGFDLLELKNQEKV